MFYEGFEKRSAWYHRLGNKVKGLFTGKEYLYHGTSPGRATGILEKGLLPDMGKGISELSGFAEENKGKVFLTKKVEQARIYSKQQQVIEHSHDVLAGKEPHPAYPESFKKDLLFRIKSETTSHPERDPEKSKIIAIGRNTGEYLGFANGKHPKGQKLKQHLEQNMTVVKAEIPKKEVSQRKTINPESKIFKDHDRGGYDVVLNGGVSPSFLKKAFEKRADEVGSTIIGTHKNLRSGLSAYHKGGELQPPEGPKPGVSIAPRFRPLPLPTYEKHVPKSTMKASLPPKKGVV